MEQPKGECKMTKQADVLRLLFPQWQGGNNPNYAFGAELLHFIAPEGKNSKTIRIPVAENYNEELSVQKGITAGSAMSTQADNARTVLEKHQPEKIIIYGGDCSIDLMPFDYLSGKYREKLGIIMLDAHPDITRSKDTTHAHESLISDLMGKSDGLLSDKVMYPIKQNQVLFGGLIEEKLRPQEDLVKGLNLPILSPEVLAETSEPIINWIKENGFEYLAIHLDLDVLSPRDFRAILPAEPGLDAAAFPAAVGEMTLKQIVRIFKDLAKEMELVGLGIAEHMPWDAINLRNALTEIDIFNE